ncbi:MAG: hypothetical protein R2705_14535 [Ilumatobacteraceae bacterium]
MAGSHRPLAWTLLEYDPYESIRSIRRAGVGPWHIEIRPAGTGFEITMTNARSRQVVQRTRAPTLAEAVSTANELISEARRNQ